MLIVFWRTYGSDWLCSDWSYTRIRRAGPKSGGMPKKEMETKRRRGNRDVRLSRFSALVWMTSCARDEGSPLGIGFQEQIPQKHTDVEFTMNETATIRLLVCSREMHPLAFLDLSGFQRREPHLYGEGRLLAREIR
jgi:hypothetical protein